MRISKTPSKQSFAKSNADDYRYRPVDKTQYPHEIHDGSFTYRTIYFSEKLVCYTKYNSRGDIMGYICAYEPINSTETEQWQVENLPYSSMYDKFELFIDTNYNNKFFKPICKLTQDYSSSY